MKKIFLLTTLLNSIILFSQIPTNGLKVYFPFNKNANDESGNNQNGTKNNVTLAKDRFNKDSSAYYFNGSNNSYIEIPSSTIQNNTNTFSVWAKFDNIPSSGDMAFMLNIGGSGGDQSLNSANNFLSTYNGWQGGGYNTVAPNFALNENAPLTTSWCHVVCVRNTKYALLYVNGTLVDSLGSSTDKYPNYGSNAKAYIGIRNNFSFPFDGWIDDVAIYDRPLSKSEVLQLFNYIPNTSVSNISKIDNIEIFPNPSSQNSFNIKSNSTNLNSSSVKIYNSIGQLQSFESEFKNENQLEIKHNLAQGAYYILVTDENLIPYKLNLIVN